MKKEDVLRLFWSITHMTESLQVMSQGMQLFALVTIFASQINLYGDDNANCLTPKDKIARSLRVDVRRSLTETSGKVSVGYAQYYGDWMKLLRI